MSVTASGLYGLSLEKVFIDTLGESLEAEDNKELLVTDTHTPNFDTHNFRDDVTDEVSGTNYSAGGVAVNHPGRGSAAQRSGNGSSRRISIIWTSTWTSWCWAARCSPTMARPASAAC